ncbi:MAG: hypothetical protein KGJ59_00455 [Bacteroidota bacterium]|nr:hypothetical protein [Bacteroidota bacterium]
MPPGASESYPYLVEFARELVPQPRRVLDVGVGFGTIGFLVRNYFEAKEHLRFSKREWKVTLIGIEIYKDSIHSLQKEIYNSIVIGDVFEEAEKLGAFDLIFLGDIIEHFAKRDGHRLLSLLLQRTKYVVIATPLGFKKQGAVGRNVHEAHKSGWVPKDFKKYSVAKSAVVPRIRKKEKVLVAALRGHGNGKLS